MNHLLLGVVRMLVKRVFKRGSDLPHIRSAAAKKDPKTTNMATRQDKGPEKAPEPEPGEERAGYYTIIRHDSS